MAFNGVGVFLVNSAGNPVVTGTTITTSWANALTADLATGLSTCVTKDGQTTTTARIPFVLGASFGATTYANGTANFLCGTTTIFNNMDTTGGQIGATRGFYTEDNAGLDWSGGTYIKGFDAVSIDIKCNTNGVTLLNGSASWAALSDERHKTAFTPFVDALAKVSGIKAGTGRYLTDVEGVSRSFLSAQSVQAVLPEAVGEKDGSLHLRYSEVIPLLVAALAEAEARISALEAR